MKIERFAKLICALLAAGFAVEGVQAQEGSVEVVTTYTPEIAPATKHLAPTVIADDPKIEPTIAYEVSPSLWQITLDAHNFKPARASYWDFTNYRPLFAKVAVGYPLGSEARVRYTRQTPRVGYWGVGLDHYGDFAPRENGTGLKRSIGESYAMSNRVSAGGGVFAGKYIFEGAVVYDNDIFNGYAMAAPERRVFHDAGIGLRFGDEFVDMERLNFSVEAHGGIWTHGLQSVADDADSRLAEYRAGGSARLARDFSSNLITLDLSYDMWQGIKSLKSGNVQIGGGVGYARRFGIVDVEVGLGYLYDKIRLEDKASHYIMPRAKVLFDINRASFAPYVEVSTSVSQNGPSSLYKRNPYIDYVAMGDKLLTMPNTLRYNLMLGFTGTAFESRLVYHAYAGLNSMSDQLFWYVTRNGMFGATTDSNNRVTVGAGAEYTPVAGLKLALDINYHYDFNSSLVADSEADLTGAFKAEYMLRRWKFYVGADMLGSRTWSIMPVEGEVSGEFTMPLCFDISAGVSYRVNNFIEVFADGENLLNSRIYDFANYYRQGVGFMLGVKMNF